MGVWLLLAVSLLLLTHRKRFAKQVLLVALILAYWQGVLLWQGVMVLGALALVGYLGNRWQHNPWLLLATQSIMVIAAVGLLYHLIPGFNNYRVIQPQLLGPHSYPPFTFYFNLDKALIPFVLFHYMPACATQTYRRPWWQWGALILSILLLGAFAVAIGALGYEYHFPAWIMLFVFANLFFAVLAEETLFRGWLQQRLSQYLGEPLALAIAALLFGLYHLAGGMQLVMLATLAGLIYGMAWRFSRSLWVVTRLHFFLNVLHLLFFTYPLLKH